MDGPLVQKRQRDEWRADRLRSYVLRANYSGHADDPSAADQPAIGQNIDRLVLVPRQFEHMALARNSGLRQWQFQSTNSLSPTWRVTGRTRRSCARRSTLRTNWDVWWWRKASRMRRSRIGCASMAATSVKATRSRRRSMRGDLRAGSGHQRSGKPGVPASGDRALDRRCRRDSASGRVTASWQPRADSYDRALAVTGLAFLRRATTLPAPIECGPCARPSDQDAQPTTRFRPPSLALYKASSTRFKIAAVSVSPAARVATPILTVKAIGLPVCQSCLKS